MPKSSRNVEKELVRDLNISWRKAKLLTAAARNELGKHADPEEILQQAKQSIQRDNEDDSSLEAMLGRSDSGSAQAVLADLESLQNETASQVAAAAAATRKDESVGISSFLCHCF